MRFPASSLPSLAALSVLMATGAGACESQPPSPGVDDAGAGGLPPVTSPDRTGKGSCPEYDPQQSSVCSQAGLRCQWNTTIETVDGYCDGTLWRVAERADGCSATPPSHGAACGQFNGSCNYLVSAAYPTAGDPREDVCLVECDCYSGKWSCTNSCKCPGKPDDDPRDFAVGFQLGAGCLHQDMRCAYRFETGKQERAEFPEVAGQPCQTTVTCSSSSWEVKDVCACPEFPRGKTRPGSTCYSGPELQCTFPPRYDGGSVQSCRCEKTFWACQ